MQFREAAASLHAWPRRSAKEMKIISCSVEEYPIAPDNPKTGEKTGSEERRNYCSEKKYASELEN